MYAIKDKFSCFLATTMSENIYHMIRYDMHMSNGAERKCALCEVSLPNGSSINICENCLKNADCCVGLENLRE
jgi:hypothetical protein